MDKINRIVYFLIIISLTALSSCKKDDSTNSTTSVDQIVTTGTWRVSYFVESTEDKTSDFTGYTFSFNTNGELVALNSGVNTTGNWGWDDSSSKFHISIGTNKPLSDLTDDWLILEKTTSLIKLKDDNPTKNELLNFSRN